MDIWVRVVLKRVSRRVWEVRMGLGLECTWGVVDGGCG